MGKYLKRALKYLIYLVVMFAIIYFVMVATGTTVIKPELLAQFFGTKNGLFMIAAIVVLSLLYPKSGFVNKSLRLDLDQENERDILLKTFEMSGFVVVRQQEDGIVFRATSPLRRLMLVFEDEVVVTKMDQFITIDGNRRAVTKIIFRLESFLLNK